MAKIFRTYSFEIENVKYVVDKRDLMIALAQCNMNQRKAANFLSISQSYLSEIINGTKSTSWVLIAILLLPYIPRDMEDSYEIALIIKNIAKNPHESIIKKIFPKFKLFLNEKIKKV